MLGIQVTYLFPPAPKQDAQKWAASRKWSVLQHLISSLQKLTETRNIAIVMLNQTATKMHPGSSAVLVSAIASTAWDAGISSRIVLFRDWAVKGKEVRLAVVVKAEGRSVGQGQDTGRVVAFRIEDVCIVLCCAVLSRLKANVHTDRSQRRFLTR